MSEQLELYETPEKPEKSEKLENSAAATSAKSENTEKPESSPQSENNSRKPSHHRQFRRQLRTRIILSFALFGLALTVLFALATIAARQRVENQLVESIMNRNLDSAWERYVNSGGQRPDAPVQQMRAYIYTPDKFEDLRNSEPDWYDLRDGIHTISGVDETGILFSYKLGVRKTPQAWFFIAYDMSQQASGESRFKQIIYASVAFFTLVSLLIGWWAAARVMRPVSVLARRLQEYRGSRNPKPLAPQFSNDEVGQLAQALDDYAERLTSVVQRDREFNADVSHELRTPLAVIRGATELLLTSPKVDDKIRLRLQRIQRAEQQCTDLIGSLLLLSRNERGEGLSHVAKVSEQLLEAHRAQLGGKPLVLRVEESVQHNDLVIQAPEAALSVALGNLIGNAVKYTQEGEVVVKLNGNSVEVHDTGPGLSAKDAAQLFQRGYRGTHAGKSQGGGIGLSIVSRLCDLYGWQVSIHPGEERGVVATLIFSEEINS